MSSTNDSKWIEGNKLIAEFMQLEMSKGVLGDSRIYYKIQLITHEIISSQDSFMYHLSFDWLMPSYFKFRDLQDITLEMYEQHFDWCGNISQAISLSESKTPKEAFSSLVEAIKWYNNQNKNNNG